MSEHPIGTLWTIGHSVRSWQDFIALLAEARIQTLVDVRRFAGSRRNPQFGGAQMGEALAAAGVGYMPLPQLGGRRPPSKDSPHTAWRNAGFRGYADYMDTADYRQARERLAQLAVKQRAAVMCAEAMWWQCHRGLIADDFKASGWQVLHVLAPGRVEEHPYTPAARIVDGRLDYSKPAEQGSQVPLF